MKEFNIEETLDNMIDELISTCNYSQNRYAKEYETEIITYVLDLERDFAELEREHEALQKLFSAQVERELDVKYLADETWGLIGSTNKYNNLKNDIQHVCKDVEGFIPEICTLDILHTLRLHGFEVVCVDESKIDYSLLEHLKK